MITVKQVLTFTPNAGALDKALKSAFGAIVQGISFWGDGRPIEAYLSDDAVQATLDGTLAIMVAHDPVFITADKLAIKADDTDAATISVQAPRPVAAACVLSINGTPITVALVAGAGTIQITAKDAGPIAVFLLNGNNRNVDTISINAQ